MATKKELQAQKKMQLVKGVFIEAEDVILHKKKPKAKVKKVLLYIETYKQNAYYEACVGLYKLFQVNPRNYHTLNVIKFIKEKVRALAFPSVKEEKKKEVVQQTLFQF